MQLDGAIFGADVRAHLVHEVVRAELNERRSGTRAAKSRGLVSGGRSKPWRQKGTGRARAGTTRAPQFTGGGIAFALTPRDFGLKVNRKVRRAALRAALSAHVGEGTLALLDGASFEQPSTKLAKAVVDGFGMERPLVVVATDEEAALKKSFRNLDQVVVCDPSELEVAAVVWARSLLVSEASLEVLHRRAA